MWGYILLPACAVYLVVSQFRLVKALDHNGMYGHLLPIGTCAFLSTAGAWQIFGWVPAVIWAGIILATIPMVFTSHCPNFIKQFSVRTNPDNAARWERGALWTWREYTV